MKPKEFKSLLKTQLPKLMVFTGDELYFKEEALTLLQRAIKAKDPKSVSHNFEIASNEKPPVAAARLVQLLLTPTLFSGANLYAVRKGDEILKAAAKPLADYADGKKTTPNRVVFFTEKLDGRTGFAKKIKSSNGIVECKKLYATPAPWQRGDSEETELVRWTRSKALDKGFTITREAAGFLTSHTGNDLFLADTELEKLSLSFDKPSKKDAKDRVIELSHVEESTGMSAIHTPFDLWEKIENHDCKEALKILSVILKNGMRSASGKLENDLAAITAILLGMFRERLKLSAQTALMVWEKRDDAHIMKELGIKSAFYLKKLKVTGSKLSADRVKQYNDALLLGERRIKRMGYAAGPVMEEVVLKMSRVGM